MAQEEEIKEYNRRISNLLKDPSQINRILLKAGIIDEQGRLTSILPEQSLVFSGGSLVANLLSGQFLPIVGAMYRVAFGAQVNNFARVANTSAIAVDTNGAMPVGINQIHIGGLGPGGSNLNGQISRFVYWPQRLPNYTLQAMTQ